MRRRIMRLRKHNRRGAQTGTEFDYGCAVRCDTLKKTPLQLLLAEIISIKRVEIEIL